MSDTQFKLDYDDDGSARQVGRPVSTVKPDVGNGNRPRRRRRIPSSVQTAITVLICGGLFFAAVRFSPEGWAPQNFTGRYIGEVAGEVKENEGAVDAEVQAYVNGVRAAYEQRTAQYGRIVEGYLEAYKAAVAVNQLQLDAANRLRGSYVERQVGQTAQTNATNISIANLGELLGQVQNFVESGSGDAALAEAQRQREIAANRIEETAVDSARVDLTGYVNALPSEEALRQRIDSLPPIDLPPLPHFTRESN